jgi:hypothetical protein
MRPIDTFEIPAINYRFVDFQNAPEDDRRKALSIFQQTLQGRLNAVRPGVGLCRPDDPNTGCDEELGIINFCVYDTRDDEIRGAFNLYNVEVDRGGMSAMAAPGMLGAGRESIPDTWRIAMRWMLENLVEEWKFPQIEGQLWKDEENADTVVSDLTSSHDVVKRGDGAPTRATRRRRGVLDGA